MEQVSRAQADAIKQKDALGTETNIVRGIQEYSHRLGFPLPNTLIEIIQNKYVCDMGSGYDAFAFDAYARGINTHITSINPGRSRLVDFYSDRMQELLGRYFGKIPASEEEQEFVRNILGEVDKDTYDFFAHNLHEIPDETFDVMIDSYAVSYYTYSTPEEFSILRASFLEMLRVLKKGGRLLIADCDFNWKTPAHEYDEEEDYISREDILREVVTSLGYTYHLLFDVTGQLAGAEVIKTS